MVSPNAKVQGPNCRAVLLLRLEGPLQSWGIRARWDVRDTAIAPTKSGLIGLLGCALGYERGDARLQELNKTLRLGVRVEHPGRVITDYQTVTDYLPTAGGGYKLSGSKTVSTLSSAKSSGVAPATIISPRAYLEDASFLVAFEQRDGQSEILEDCAAALQSPKWPLFLGRKSCVPTRPIFDATRDGLRDEYADIESALASHPWDWRGAKRFVRKVYSDAKPLRTYIEDPKGAHEWQDVVLPGSGRFYGFRQVCEGWVDFQCLIRVDSEAGPKKEV